jgi:hypothetical protein
MRHRVFHTLSANHDMQVFLAHCLVFLMPRTWILVAACVSTFCTRRASRSALVRANTCSLVSVLPLRPPKLTRRLLYPESNMASS